METLIKVVGGSRLSYYRRCRSLVPHPRHSGLAPLELGGHRRAGLEGNRPVAGSRSYPSQFVSVQEFQRFQVLRISSSSKGESARQPARLFHLTSLGFTV